MAGENSWIWPNTFSICALDPRTGEAGVAVASACLCVGALVPYAEPGVGAVATQALVNPDYGTSGLALLRKRAAAVRVVRDRGHWTGMDRYCDARVDDDKNPVGKIGRLVDQFENG